MFTTYAARVTEETLPILIWTAEDFGINAEYLRERMEEAAKSGEYLYAILKLDEDLDVAEIDEMLGSDFAHNCYFTGGRRGLHWKSVQVHR